MINLIPLKVYPSAGHHNADPGAVANGYREADLTKEFRNLLSEEFKKHNHDHIMDYDWETNRQHQNRIKPGSGSVLLDIHFNAFHKPTATGTEVFVAHNANQNSIDFATELAETTSRILGIHNRGVKKEGASQHSRIGILHTKAGIAALLEICFITNPDDMKAYQEGKLCLAVEIAKICMKYDDLIP